MERLKKLFYDAGAWVLAFVIWFAMLNLLVISTNLTALPWRILQAYCMFVYTRICWRFARAICDGRLKVS